MTAADKLLFIRSAYQKCAEIFMKFNFAFFQQDFKWVLISTGIVSSSTSQNPWHFNLSFTCTAVAPRVVCNKKLDVWGTKE